MKKHKDSGFTLVELVVVIVILAILIGVTITGVLSWVNKARINTDIHNCNTLRDTIYTNVPNFRAEPLKKPYVWVGISNNSTNLFNASYFCTETGFVEPAEIIGSNGKKVNKTDFETLVKECYKSEIGGTNKIPWTTNTKHNIFIAIHVDALGTITNVKVGLIKPGVSTSGFINLITSTYFPDVYSGSSGLLSNYVVYDGIVSYI